MHTLRKGGPTHSRIMSSGGRTAEEARRASEDSEFKKVNTIIIIHSEDGLYECHRPYISPAIRARLLGLGFEVYRDEDCDWTVSWLPDDHEDDADE